MNKSPLKKGAKVTPRFCKHLLEKGSVRRLSRHDVKLVSVFFFQQIFELK